MATRRDSAHGNLHRAVKGNNGTTIDDRNVLKGKKKKKREKRDPHPTNSQMLKMDVDH